jgi:alanine racemase
MTHVPHHLASAVVTIDLAALQSNFRTLSTRAGVAVGVPIKGAAYGLGLEPVAKALWAAGARHYFVARPMEGQELRAVLPDALIYVLDGFYVGQAEFYVRNGLIPALSNLDEAKAWAKDAKGSACALHVDSGINRLGFTAAEFAALLADEVLKAGLNVNLLMSHLACSDEPDHPLNAKQRETFSKLRKLLPDVPASFANSSGIYLDGGYLYDLVRPGVALYGGNPLPGKPNPMKPVVTLQAKVMQTRIVKQGDTIGYSATWTAPRDSCVAILGAGYRDGIPRKLSSSHSDGPGQVFIAGRRVPIVGRVSMDMMACDVTGIPEGEIERGTLAEIFGSNIWAIAITAATLGANRRERREYICSHRPIVFAVLR